MKRLLGESIEKSVSVELQLKFQQKIRKIKRNSLLNPDLRCKICPINKEQTFLVRFCLGGSQAFKNHQITMWESQDGPVLRGCRDTELFFTNKAEMRKPPMSTELTTSAPLHPISSFPYSFAFFSSHLTYAYAYRHTKASFNTFLRNLEFPLDYDKLHLNNSL